MNQILLIIAVVCYVLDAFNVLAPVKLFSLGTAFAVAAFAF